MKIILIKEIQNVKSVKMKKTIHECHDIKLIKPNMKVRHHCHYSGNFKNVLCNSCNIKEGKRNKFVPIYFLNLGYDSHLFIKELVSNQYQINEMLYYKELLNVAKSEDYVVLP